MEMRFIHLKTELFAVDRSYNGWVKEGRYTRKLQSKSGIDSIVTTFLTVNPVFNITESRTICQGQNYYGWTTSGTYTRSLKSVSGCDSIVITNLKVNPNSNECKPVVYTAYFKEGNGDTLIVGNKDYYEIGINKKIGGGFLYIKDKKIGKNTSIISPFSCMLWGAKMKDGTDIWSTPHRRVD